MAMPDPSRASRSPRDAIVKPRPISGFPEWSPAEKLVEDRILRIIREEYERYGFTPVETPAVERIEVLTAKGVAEKEIYALSRLAAAEGEESSTDMALHFDLTVPLARYVAQRMNELAFPFRRYQIQKVWRGERPQAGRFREFYQCDIDIIGNGSLGLIADAEIPLVINAIFARIGVGRFRIRINNRKVLQGLLDGVGAGGPLTAAALRAIDALEKVGPDRVLADLQAEAGLTVEAARRVLDTLSLGADLEAARRVSDNALYREGLDELAEVTSAMATLGLPPDVAVVDFSIARGLDYYTGTVYETQLLDAPEIGSVCSGGRYEDLASTFTRARLPGVGISIGLSRMLARLFEAGILVPGASTPARVLVTQMDASQLDRYLAFARELRAAGIPTELYLEPRKIGQQLKYADQKGFAVAVIAGDAEAVAGTVQIKHLASGRQETCPAAELVARVTALAGPPELPPT